MGWETWNFSLVPTQISSLHVLKSEFVTENNCARRSRGGNPCIDHEKAFGESMRLPVALRSQGSLHLNRNNTF